MKTRPNTVIWQILTLFMAITFSAGPAMAKVYPRFYRGVRPLGMGDAFTAVADDENALFYNPAGLAKIDTLTFAVVNPLVEASAESIDMASDADDTDLDDTGEVADLLRDYIGEHQHVRGALFPHVGFNVGGYGIMVGFLAQATLDAEIRDPIWPEADTDYVFDRGLIAGVGGRIPFMDLRLGAALKYISRSSLNEVYTATDIADDDFEDDFEDDLEDGSAVALDLGVIYSLPWIDWAETDVGFTIQHLPEMQFGNALNQETQANIGIAAKKGFGGFNVIAAVDYVDLTHAIGEDRDVPKRLHLGGEVQLPMILSLRLGLNQGYLSYGISADLWALKLDFAAYTEEAGAHAGQRDDRRYAGQISFGW
ncbi:MAG: conjugal transfer protein TraF [Desulfosarcinaceae bacterium]|nr:conjugal transfer protein TraF [Desulfosarcinaceae bacterium]